MNSAIKKTLLITSLLVGGFGAVITAGLLGAGDVGGLVVVRRFQPGEAVLASDPAFQVREIRAVPFLGKVFSCGRDGACDVTFQGSCVVRGMKNGRTVSASSTSVTIDGLNRAQLQSGVRVTRKVKL